VSLEQRIPADLMGRLVENPYRHPNRYVQQGSHRLLAETTCKVCGTALTAIMPDPRIPSSKRELRDTNVRTVIIETFVCRHRTEAFDTIEFEMDEPTPEFVPEGDETKDAGPALKSAHRSAICQACKAKLLSDEVPDLLQVQQLYEADLERMAVEDDVNGRPVTHTLSILGWLSQRKVTRIL
jgi:hypothetical protein